MRPTYEVIRKSSLNTIAYYASSQLTSDAIAFMEKPANERAHIIFDEIYRIFKVDFPQMNRRYPFRFPRYIFCYVCRGVAKEFSLMNIGKMLNNRDHTSVIHALQTTRDLIDSRDQLFMEYWHRWVRNAPPYLVPHNTEVHLKKTA